jgi:hypothetical protein
VSGVRVRPLVLGAAAAIASSLAPRALRAQIAPSAGLPVRTAPRPLPELRLDAIVGTHDQLHVGAGLIVPLGTYVRAVPIVAGGVARVDDERRGSARAEGVVRFLLDPLRERRWGVYGGAGVGASWIDGEGWRTPLVVVLGVEGRARGGHAVAMELGLGGGARLGVAVRRTREGRR